MSTAPDAAESEAGDDFHKLWAARKALVLLDESDPLVAIRPEGPAPEDAAELDPYGDQLLGIDMSEYFGGANFKTATSVTYSQLKYSTRRRDLSWNATRLVQGKKSGSSKGSLIHRLAQAFKRHLDEFGRADTLEKLTLRLVSNRDCSETIRDLLDEAKDKLQETSGEVLYNDLKKRVSKELREDLRKLKGAAIGLSSAQFSDFVRVFEIDLEDSRLELDIALAKQIGTYGFRDTNNQYAELKELISRRMMPENRKAPPIQAVDVLPRLGVPIREHLFPASSDFESLGNPIETSSLGRIAKRIVDAPNRKLCVHGGAGIGKTTLVRMLGNELPTGSRTVVFDCYGAGTYLDPAEERHSHERAVVQICSELATQVGTALLLEFRLSHSDLLRELKKRMTNAATLLRDSNPNAVLMLVIDAADNSLAAGVRFQQPTLVADLCKTDVPEGCRLIVTARSHRRESCEILSSLPESPIGGFEIAETRTRLRRSIPNATEHQVEEFQELTGGIPRVQSYALAFGSDYEKVVANLRPGGKTVASIIDAQLKQASQKAGTSCGIQEMCSALIALPRPIPISCLSEITGESASSIQDFTIDLCHGLREKNKCIGFRDEDFENHLRDTYPIDNALRERIVEHLWENRDRDPYSAAHVADALNELGDGRRLFELTMKDRTISVIGDPLEQKSVFTNRARLALQHAIETQDNTEILQLIFAAGRAAKTDRVVTELLQANADLACRYGNPTSLQRLYLKSRNSGSSWKGSIHFRLAAHFSRSASDHELAGIHLSAAKAWARWVLDEPKSDRREDIDNDAIDNECIANGAEAIFRLQGIQAATKWLSGWRPKSAVFKACQLLAKSVCSENAGDLLSALETHPRLRGDAILVVVAEMMKHGVVPPESLVSRGLTIWVKAVGVVGPSHRLLALFVHLCEAAARLGIGQDESNRLLSTVVHRRELQSVPWLLNGEEAQDWRELVQAHALLATLNRQTLSPSDSSLLPEDLRELREDDDDTKHKRESRKEHIDFLEAILPAFNLRTRILLRQEEDGIQSAFEEAIKAPGRHEYRRHGVASKVTSITAMVVIEALTWLTAEPSNVFHCLAPTLTKVWRDLKVDVADIVSRDPRLVENCIASLEEVVHDVKSGAIPGSEAVSTLVRASRIASRFDDSIARLYFDNAIDAASEFDEEAFSMLELIGTLACKGGENPDLNEPELAEAYASVVEECVWRFEHWEHFPLDLCTRGITALSPGVSIAVHCRWDQRGVVRIQAQLAEIVYQLQQQERVEPSIAIGLGLIGSIYDGTFLRNSTDAITRLQKEATDLQTATELVADHVSRLVSFSNRPALVERYWKYLETAGLSERGHLAWLKELQSFLSDRSNIGYDNHIGNKGDETTRPMSLTQERDEEPEIRVQDFLDGCDLTEGPSIAGALAMIANASADRYKANRWKREFLSEAIPRLSPGNYVDHLAALLQVDSDVLEFYALKDALTERRKAWQFHPAVRSWLADVGPTIVERYGKEFWIRDEHFSGYNVNFLVDDLGIDRPTVLSEILAQLPRFLKDLNARALFEFAKELTEATSKSQETIDVLRYVIPDVANDVTRDDLVSTGVGDLVQKEDDLELVAALLWFLLGHPDKRIRWQAVHAARQIARLGQPAIISSLARRIDRRTHPFSIDKSTFYWLAARQWFFMLLERLANEMPNAVLSLRSEILNYVRNTPDPHILTLDYATKTLRALNALEPFLERQDEELLRRRMEPRIDGNERDRDTEDYSYDRRSDGRFHFDSMNTLPYWYKPLGKMFGIACDEFCRLAEDWICDKWESICRYDAVEEWIRDDDRRDWGLYSHDHGSDPTIENLASYLEFNAMFSVAADLVSRDQAIHPEWDWETAEERWNSWLSEWRSRDSGWLADRRDRAPLQPRFWFVPQWRLKKAVAIEFDQTVGIDNQFHPGFIVVWGTEEIWRSEAYQTTRIASALVPDTTAQSLLCALECSEYPGNHRIPWEDDDHEVTRRVRIGTDEFGMQGWIACDDASELGVQSHDPYRYEYNPGKIQPGRIASEILRLQAIEGERHKRWVNDSETASIAEQWNDCVPGRESGGFRTYGNRLWFNVEALTQLLVETNCSLMIRCQLHRYRSGTSKSQEEYRDERPRFYLVRQDGTVETPEESD